MEPILIFGHKNPDTDSICSAIALARLKELKGENATPCRLGNLNKETEFVLKTLMLKHLCFFQQLMHRYLT